MAKIEVEESELQNLQQLKGVFDAMNKDQVAALALEDAYKRVNPNAKTPRRDALAQQTAPVDELKKQVSELEKKLAEEKAEGEKNAKLAQLQQKIDGGNAKLRSEGWTEDGIKMLDKFREEQGILDPIAAAAYYEKLNGPQVTPATPSSGIGRWDFTEVPEGGEAYAKKLLETRGDSETLVMNEAMKALNDFRGPQRR